MVKQSRHARLHNRLGITRLALQNFYLALFHRIPDDGLDEVLVTHPPQLAGLVGRPRSLVLRHLDCGSCNGCELALQRADNPIYDLGQYNIKFEASPRAAYVLAMTGPYVTNLRNAAIRTLRAMPVPAVIAIGDCAVGGGDSLFTDFYTLATRDDEFNQKILLSIPGCPPSVEQLRDGFLSLVKKLDSNLHV
jgi:Ni,Fe-hydrogenase III small subunit